MTDEITTATTSNIANDPELHRRVAAIKARQSKQSKTKKPKAKSGKTARKSNGATAKIAAKAIELYKTTDKSMAEIAKTCGLEDDTGVKSIGWIIWKARKNGKVGYRNELSAKAKKAIGGKGRVA